MGHIGLSLANGLWMLLMHIRLLDWWLNLYLKCRLMAGLAREQILSRPTGCVPLSGQHVCCIIMTALMLCCMYTICILYMPDTNSPWFLPPNWPTQTHQHHRRPKANLFFYLLALLFQALSFSFFGSCFFLPLPLVLPQFSVLSSHSCCHTSSLKTDLVMCRSQQRGLRWENMDGWWTNGSALQTAQTMQYLMWGRWQQNTQSLLNR